MRGNLNIRGNNVGLACQPASIREGRPAGLSKMSILAKMITVYREKEEMNGLVDRFGRIVGDSIQRHPKRALSLLKTAYTLSGLQKKYFIDNRLLPHQKYAAIVCNSAIRDPLSKPERAAVASIFMPCEILHAAGMSPLFAEGLACFINGAGSERAFIRCAEAHGVPQTYCSYHKVLLGAALAGVLPKPRFVVYTTLACDANNSTFRLLADHWRVPRFAIDVPCMPNPDAVDYVAAQLRELAAFLRDLGVTFDEDNLCEVIRSENRSVRMYREYFRILAGKYLPNNVTSEMYKVFFTHVLMGTGEAERYFRLLLEDVKSARPAEGQIRILWAHALPFWQDCVKNIFNYGPQYQLLCCDLNLDSDMELDEDRPYKSLSRKLLSNAYGGCVDRRIGKLAETAKFLQADGVVYFSHWGCKQTLGGAYLAENKLEGAGIPTLILDGDGCDRENVSEEQTATRLQAFLEILEARK